MSMFPCPILFSAGVSHVCSPSLDSVSSATRGISHVCSPLLGRDRGFPGRNIRPFLFRISYVEQTAPSGCCRWVQPGSWLSGPGL